MTNNKPLRAVLWLAVSSQIQASEDKISLPEQERLEREYCSKHGIQVIDVLSVPGHSRSESDVITALEELAAAGCYAYHKLRQHWKARDFDLLIAYDSSRLARSASLFTFVVENVVKNEANIYLIDGGLIDATNVEFQMALGGISATAGIKRLVRLRDVAMDDKASRGLPTSSAILMSHMLLRDDRYQPIKLLLNPQYKQLWQDVATLLLEGVGWGRMSLELHRRWGHTNPRTGREYSHGKLYKIVFNPTFWGHTARHFTRMDKAAGRGYYGLWMVEEGHPIPEGIEVYYHTHEAVFGPDDPRTAAIKAELRRRVTMSGRRRPDKTHRFSGLIMCANCGNHMVVYRNKGYGNYNCPYVRMHHFGGPCTNRTSINVKIIQQYLDNLLREAMQRVPLEFLLQPREQPTHPAELSTLEKAIAAAERKARKLVTQQAENERDELTSTYRELLDETNRELKRLRSRHEALRMSSQQQERVQQQQTLALEEIVHLSLERFWLLPEHEINQVLHRLFGQRRLVIDGGRIVGSADASRKAPRRTKSKRHIL